MAFPIDTAQELIGQLYVGYCGRAADPEGLSYWVDRLNGGMSLVAIANSFAVQPEVTARYPYLAAPSASDPVAFITAIYQDLFNRGPDAGGVAYWVDQLTVQGTPPGQMVLNIISGAQGADKTTIENKTHVAVDYADKFVVNNLTWIGIDYIQSARDVVTPVTSDPATVAAAIQQIDGITSSTGNVDFSGVLLPGEFLFGGPGNKDTLTLQNGDVAEGILIGFERLAIPSGFSGTLSIRQWNDFHPITGGGANSAAYFRDGQAPLGSTITIVSQIGHYDFSKLTALTGAITVNTQAFLGAGPLMQAGSTLIATDFNDTFSVDEGDLDNALKIDGGKGIDTLNVDVMLTFGNAFGQVGDAGTTDAVVLNVENLNLLDAANNVGFNAGTQFTKVIGGSGQDTIRGPETLAGAWFLDVMGGSGVSTNIIQVSSKVANLSVGTIQATGGFVALDISAGGPSNTTMTFQQYQLFENSAIGAIFGIITSGGSAFGNTTVTFSDRVTGGTVLDDAVGSWVFSAADDAFTLGSISQSIDVSSGGADTATLSLGGAYDGTFKGGSSNDTIQFAGNVDITGINGGAVTTFGRADFMNTNRSVIVTFAQYNGLAQSLLNTAGTQTIALNYAGTAEGDAGIEQYILNAGPGSDDNVFTVAADNGLLTTGSQSVDFNGGTDIVVFGTGKFSGTMNGAGFGAGDTTKITGNADVSNVNGGKAITSLVDFDNQSTSTTMTTDQHNGFAQPFGKTGGTQTITLSTDGNANGDSGVENYVLVDGPYTFTVSSALPSQNVDIAGSSGGDTIIYGSATFAGRLVGTAANDTVQFIGNANVAGINGGNATGAGNVDFSNAGLVVTMTLAQHNGFTRPFGNTGGTQTIKLATSGTAIGDVGIEQYVLAEGDDTFTAAPDNKMANPPQTVDVSSGGSDVLVFAGAVSGQMKGVTADDTYRFVAGGGDVDITGLKNTNDVVGGATGAGKLDFADSSIHVSMTALQYNGPLKPLLINTRNAQTITLTSALATIILGDGGIENYVLAGSGSWDFTVAKNDPQLAGGKQNVTAAGGPAADVIKFGIGTFSGDVMGLTRLDTVKFVGGVGVNSDISGVNGGATLNGKANFNNSPVTVAMTVAQHQGFVAAGSPFDQTNGTQTIALVNSGVTTGDTGIENYFLGGSDDDFTVVADFGSFTQNVDISAGGNDILTFGAGTFSGNLIGGGVGDTVRFAGGTTDVSGVNGGGAMSPKSVSFGNTDVSASMTLVQHNDFAKDFLDTGGAGKTQIITLTTDGTTTGDKGIEQYILGQDDSDSNRFTIGVADQNVTGRSDDDTVINPFSGPTGILLGGAHNVQGDTLVLQAVDTDLTAGSGEFENLTLAAAAGSPTVRMNVKAHNEITNKVFANGSDDTVILSDFTADVIGLENIENYTLEASTGALVFTLSDSQTGTITGSLGGDIIKATGEQMRVASLKIDAKGGGDTLMITTDAREVDLQARTTAIGTFHLLAGSTKNVVGANGDNVTVSATGNTIFTMGSAGASQNYIGGVGGKAGIDQVTSNVGSTNISTRDHDDTVTSLVGGALTGIYDGGAGFDTLSLANGDDITGATVVNFENLVLASNASVKMTAAQYAQFTGSSAAPGVNTVTLDTTGGGVDNKVLFADIENWVLLDGPMSTYTITGDNQFVTDLRNVEIDRNVANIAAGLTGVTLLVSGGVGMFINDLGGGINHTITVPGGSGLFTFTTLQLGGVHTGLSVQLSQDSDDLIIAADSKIAGTLNGGATTNDSLRPFKGADISEATFSNFEHLYVADGVRLNADLWDQFVGTNGKVNSLSKSVQGTSLNGPETIDLTTTHFNITTAYSGTTGSTLTGIEGYKLSNPGDDFLRVNTNYIDVSNVYVATVDLSGGGTDFIVLNDTRASFSGLNLGSTLTNFGSGLGGDLVQIQLNGNSISSGSFQLITADNTNVAQTTVVINSSSILMDDTWDQGEARTLLKEAIGTIATGTYTMTAYFAGATSGAYIMGVEIVNADNPATANIDLIGILSSVGVNTLTSDNFT